MGAFFTNLQVRHAIVGDVVEAIRADARARGMDEIEGETGSDRGVVILPPENGWITVYDEATEGQDGASLATLAQAVTKATGGYALTASIHDSDILDLRLYLSGSLRDRLDSAPGYFGEKVSKKKRAEVAGDPAQWKELTGDERALASAWRSEDLFAERTLARTCEIVGVDVARAMRGYRYFHMDGVDAPPGTITLRFRARTRPAWETTREGPPQLEVHAQAGAPYRLAIPDEVRIPLSSRNVGGASKGVEIRCWGSALAEGIVAIDRFELLVGGHRSGTKDLDVVPVATRSADGAPMLVATVADREIPAGGARPAFGPGVDVMKMMEALQRAVVHVNAVGRAIAPGAGELGIALVPTANPSQGAAATIARIEVEEALPRPLRAQPSERIGSHVLRPLAGDRYLVALVAVDRPRAAVAAIARGMIEDARAAIDDEGAVRTAIYLAKPGKRPKSGQGKAKTLLRGKRFDALIEAMGREQAVSIDAGDRLGIAVGTGVLPHFEEERVPTIAAWIEGPAEEVRARWSARIDAAMQDGAIQATLYRCGQGSTMADTSAYETACGIAHGIGTLREWTTRWVRVPGNDRLWLSSALAGRIDRGALAPIATLDPLGSAVRITLRDRAAWRELERAIEGILPTAEESHAVTRAFFERHRDDR